MKSGRGVVVLGVLCLCAHLPPSAAASGGPRCTIIGSNGPDKLHGTRGRDVICGRGGADRIRGGRGPDLIRGGRGADLIRGGPGADLIRGGAGADVLIGGAGGDTLLGGVGTDTCRDSATTRRRGCDRPRSRYGQPPAEALPSPTICCVQAPEAKPPDLFWLSLSRFVDTSVAEPRIGLNIEAWDASGVRSIELEIEGPEGHWDTLSFDGEPTPRTTIERNVEVPAGTPGGDYRISRLVLTDNGGNTELRDAGQLASAGFRAEFTVFHGPDEDPPELTGLSFPGQVDTTGGPADVALTFEATDANSGVDAIAVTVVPPDHEPPWVVIGGGYDNDSHLISGTRQAGTWQRTERLDEDARLGYYRIASVRLRDVVGRERSYNTIIGRTRLPGRVPEQWGARHDHARDPRLLVRTDHPAFLQRRTDHSLLHRGPRRRHRLRGVAPLRSLEDGSGCRTGLSVD